MCLFFFSKLCKIVVLSSFLTTCSASVSKNLLFQAIISSELLNYFDILYYWKELPKFKDDLQTHTFNPLWESVRITVHRSNNSTQHILEAALNTLSTAGDWWERMRSHTCETSLQPSHVCVGACICACTHACACMESKRPVPSLVSSVCLCLMFWRLSWSLNLESVYPLSGQWPPWIQVLTLRWQVLYY